MTKLTLFLLLCVSIVSNAETNSDLIEPGTSAIAFGKMNGKIIKIFVGNENFYGVRFYLNLTLDTTAGICNPNFAYIEPSEFSGFDSKLSVFMSAYMANKNVSFTVESGRNGVCSIREGYME